MGLECQGNALLFVLQATEVE